MQFLTCSGPLLNCMSFHLLTGIHCVQMLDLCFFCYRLTLAIHGGSVSGQNLRGFIPVDLGHPSEPNQSCALVGPRVFSEGQGTLVWNLQIINSTGTKPANNENPLVFFSQHLIAKMHALFPFTETAGLPLIPDLFLSWLDLEALLNKCKGNARVIAERGHLILWGSSPAV